MKRKIIALMMATISAVSLFAACGESGIACTNHVDANKDDVCDSCFREIVTVNESVQLKKDDVVETVVKPIPENAKLSDLINWTKVEKQEVVETSGVIDYAPVLNADNVKGMREMRNGFLLVTTDYTQEIDESNPQLAATTPKKDTYTWYSYDLETTYYTFTSGEYTNSNQDIRGGMTRRVYDSNIVVMNEVKFIKDEYYNEYEDMQSWMVYTSAGDFLFREDFVYQDMPSFAEKTVGNYTYYSYMNKTYVVDNETAKLVYQDYTSMITVRPDFDYVTESGEYGVVEQDGKVYVYALNSEKWIDLVSTVDLKMSSAVNSDGWYIGDNKYLVVKTVKLSDDAVNYDVLTGGLKLDMQYVVYDLLTGEGKELEFGYAITEVEVIAEEMGYVDSVKLMVGFNKIVDKTIDTNTLYISLTDAELNVLYAQSSSDRISVMPVANGVNQRREKYTDEYSYAPEYVDYAGNVIDITGFTVSDDERYLMKDNKIYLWSDLENAKLDLTIYNKGIVAQTDDYMIVMNAGEQEGEEEYYYVNLHNFTVTKVDELNRQYYSQGFLVNKKQAGVSDDGTNTPVYEYTLYNVAYEELATFESAISEITETENGWIVNTEDDNAYFLKK